MPPENEQPPDEDFLDSYILVLLILSIKSREIRYNLIMNKALLVENTANYVKNELEHEGSGHDWWHIERVWKMANRIGSEENADLFIVEMAALLHEIADYKLNDGDDEKGIQRVKIYLAKTGINTATQEQIVDIISHMSFRKTLETGANKRKKALEEKVVQDADRLDSIGAVGIARVFTYSGHHNRPIHNPNIKPENFKSMEQYKKNSSSAINHFYEKLLLLKDMMNTKTGKEIAEGRHKYMKEFLKRFYHEWEGTQ